MYRPYDMVLLPSPEGSMVTRISAWRGSGPHENAANTTLLGLERYEYVGVIRKKPPNTRSDRRGAVDSFDERSSAGYPRTNSIRVEPTSPALRSSYTQRICPFA
jgi:hypothetical protein